MVAADGHAMGPAHPRRRLDPVPVTESKHGNPLRVDFEHRGVELKLPGTENESSGGGNVVVGVSTASISSLKSIASPPVGVGAHMWRCITAARRLDGSVVTMACVAVDGRTRLRHPPLAYIGNVVLWARPSATTVELASPAVARTDGRYFRSFVDFASSGSVEQEWLVPTPEAAKMVLSSDVEVYSLLGFAFRDIDFGSGVPFFHMRGYVAEEGLVFLVPSLSGHGSV
ncbi:hypothetical protein EJB05_26715, partial [Eragrostis curvula]